MSQQQVLSTYTPEPRDDHSAHINCTILIESIAVSQNTSEQANNNKNRYNMLDK